MTAKTFLRKMVLKCLWVSKFMDIGLLRPATLTQVIEEVVDVGQVRTVTLYLLIEKDMLI